MPKHNPDEKINKLQRKETQNSKLGCLNYCVTGLMSRCSAGTAWEEQKKCKFAEKSTVSSRCMYYIEAIGGHCDCVEAQKELRQTKGIKEDDT